MTTDDQAGVRSQRAATAGRGGPGLVALLASLLIGGGAACWSAASRNDASADAVADTPPDLQPDAPPDLPGESHPDAQAEASPDAGVDRSDADAGPCIRPLAEVATVCPATYDDIESFACGRCPGTCSLFAGSCGDFLIFAERFTFDTSLCYYDATSRALVSLVHSTDVNIYCGGSAYYYSAGVSVGACERPFFNPGVPPYVCSNGGPFDGAVPDLSPDSSGG